MDPIERLGVPASEFNEGFIQSMRQRMAVSYHKYGRMYEAPVRTDMPASVQQRLDKYIATGNTEWLIDAANCCMIEYSNPQHSDAHFRSTDSDESPGRVLKPKVNVMGAVVPQGVSHASNDALD